MLFNSHIFIFLFLPVALCVFHLLGLLGKPKIVIGWLVAASLFFYAWWNPVYVGLIIFSIVVNFTIGCRLGKYYNRPKKRRSFLLVFGLCFNLGLLAYYKYTNFFLNNINAVFHAHFPNEHIILPLGISFFTFQKVAYLVDAYEGKTKEYSFLNFCLFVTFFPQLIAGPIVHHQEMMPQFNKNKYVLSNSDFAVGITFFALGLFKKVMIADNLALFATPVFEMARDAAAMGTVTAWIGALCYTFQIYFDFSGYSDMAIGLARMFGIKLPLNFNSPYKSVGIIDFWRRWHMTLSRLLRDYLYIPLGGNRCGKARRYVNLMLVMTIGGLWHGASWTFVLWGVCHGFYLLINHLWRKAVEVFQWNWSSKTVWRSLAQISTFVCVVFAWVLFRSPDVSTALHMYQGMFHWSPSHAAKAKFYAARILSLVGCAVLVFLFPNTQELLRRFDPALNFKMDERESFGLMKWLEWKPNAWWSVAVCLIFLVSIFNMLKVSEFLYFQF